MADTQGRVAPLAQPWSDEDATAIGRWGHPEATYPPLLLTRCLQRIPALADRTRALGESLYLHGQLSARQRTIAILRTCAQIRCAYEWGGQAAFWGPIAGLTEDECDALVLTGPDDPRWSPQDSALIAAVDELEATGSLGDAIWAALDLTDEQRMELLVVAGWYRTICTLCNAMALPNEDWMRPWPVAAATDEGMPR
ncbi:carboxymuconolactone decarboxylase family protein [Nocardioides caeni]|uniref:Carboxymuconolactone decarboxylase family protein n=1 Tax=Nocardioides caeni TaxID=574700 RepID=A0A4S8NAT0_9ACTN|nr:carboxymuconolactone decarboxylase family protein [Nocardioides caeni]THV12179.1 carboxymuconolactone decarboxylase family protein [Nocardioides caeni]